MNTVCINLVPFERRQAARRRVRRRGWLTACTVYALCGIVAGLFVHLDPRDEDHTLWRDHAQMPSQVADALSEVASLRGQLELALAELRARNAVGRQPDWSVLLALLTRALGDQIVLREVRLGSLAPSAPRDGSTTRGASIRLDCSGLGQSQADVSQFLLRLEQVPLIRSAKLINTRREPFLRDTVVAFGVECVVDAGGEATP